MPDSPILVVDDNAVNRLAMKALLTKLGYASELVRDGYEALEAFKTRTYSLILMDINMPGMDGFATTEAIRKIEFGASRNIPIIAVTALPEDARDDCIRAGMNDFIQKPVHRESLMCKIDQWLQDSTEAGTVPIGADKLLSEYDATDVHQILDAFLHVTESLLSELEVAICKRDQAMVRRVALELKGSSLQVSAGEIAKLCLNLEASKSLDDWDEMLKVYAALAHAFARVKSFVVEKQYSSLVVAANAMRR